MAQFWAQQKEIESIYDQRRAESLNDELYDEFLRKLDGAQDEQQVEKLKENMLIYYNLK